MSDIHAILFSNDKFYLAFTQRNLRDMDDVWARNAPVSCAHPGWELISGRDAVLKSWHDILTAADETFTVECRRPIAHFTGTMGYVTCHEILGNASLLATNIFVHEKGIWKMVHHHAGPAPLPEEDDEDPGNGTDIPTTLQ